MIAPDGLPPGDNDCLERYLVVLCGAGLGGLARYAVGTAVAARYNGRFPIGTLAVNVSGSFLAGALMILLTEKYLVHPNWRLFLVVGLLGGYTTFSAFEYETFVIARSGARALAILYVAASVILGSAAVWLGAWLAGRR
jgi:fluoride exporter